MNNELMEALDVLEKEKNISKTVLLEAIEQSLIQACKNHFGKADNVKVDIDPNTCEFSVHAEKTVVEEVEDPVMEIRRKDEGFPLRGGRCGKCGDQIEGVRTHRNTECEKCNPPEDP